MLMPSSHEILEQATAAADGLEGLAIAWHVVILVSALALLRRKRLSPQYAAVLLAGPALSVFVVSAIYNNWFNAVSFGLLALVLMISASELEGTWRSEGPRWMLALGTALVAFGFFYPHFTTGAWYRSFYAAPIGLVPCPTLAILAGFTLLEGGHRSTAIPAVLAAWTAFYGAFGILKLGVSIDVGLIVGTVGLSVLAARNRRCMQVEKATRAHGRDSCLRARARRT